MGGGVRSWCSGRLLLFWVALTLAQLLELVSEARRLERREVLASAVSSLSGHDWRGGDAVHEIALEVGTDWCLTREPVGRLAIQTVPRSSPVRGSWDACGSTAESGCDELGPRCRAPLARSSSDRL